jgi:formylglycine-generating enzyme required for sulfatase activity
MKKILIILFAFFLITPLFAAEKKPKQKLMASYIAVFDFERTSKVDKDIVRPLTESIRRELVMSGKYEVIDRGNMNKILSEQKLQLSGCVSGQCIVEAGQILGVGKIITGSVSKVGKTYYLTLSLINIETGKIENISEDKCKCEIDDLIDSTKRLAKRLLGETVASPEPQTEQKTVIASETKQSQKPLSTTEPIKGMEMVLVKGGCFQMGDTFGDGESDEKPVHEVCVDDFYIGKHEVTVGQFKKFVNDTGYDTEAEKGNGCDVWTGSSWKAETNKNWRNVGFSQDDSHPVACVSWNDAVAFTDWLKNKTGKNYKLPTEAEWEYAARSGGKNEKYTGGNDVDSVAWYASNSGSKTHQVGQKKQNGLGLYDMSGNVWEWVQDSYKSDAYKQHSQKNPIYTGNNSYRTSRGGSWSSNVKFVRASNRGNDTPDYRLSDLGFRIAVPVK